MDRDMMSQKTLIGFSNSQSQGDGGFVDLPPLDDEEDGMKSIPPNLSQELLTSSTQESGLSIQIDEEDLGMPPGALDNITKSVAFGSYPLDPDPELPSSSTSSGSKYLVDPTTCSPYANQGKEIGIAVPSGGSDDDNQQHSEIKFEPALMYGPPPSQAHSRFGSTGKRIYEEEDGQRLDYDLEDQYIRNYEEDNNMQSQSQFPQSSQSRNMGAPSTYGHHSSSYLPMPVNNPESSSEVSSSQESNRELPSSENWAGKYNFNVEPGEPNIKQCIYFQAKNKLFCLQYKPILFKMRADFKNPATKTMSVRAMLVFKNSASSAEPVQRCINCVHTEQKERPTIDPLLMPHVLRSTHTKATFEQSANSHRYYTVAPLDKPQPGADYVAKTYEFTCLSSCKGITRKHLCLIFTLLNNGRTVGRQSFDLKICACPSRDCKKEMEQYADAAERQRFSSGRRGNKRGGRSLGLELDQVAKRRAISPNPEDDYEIEDDDDDAQEGVGNGGEVEIFNDSQNTAEVLQTVTQTVRFIMSNRKSPNPNKARFAKVALGQVKALVDTVEYFKDNSNDGVQGEGEQQGQGQGQAQPVAGAAGAGGRPNIRFPPGIAGSPDSGVFQTP